MQTIRSRSAMAAVVVMVCAALLAVLSASAAASVKTIFPPPPPPPGQTPVIDRSVMRSQSAGAAALFNLKVDSSDAYIHIDAIEKGNGDFTPYAARLERDLVNILDVPRARDQKRLADPFYVGVSAYAGQGRPIEVLPDLLYEQSRDRVTLTYKNLFDGLNGQDIGIQYAVLPTDWKEYYYHTNALLSYVAPYEVNSPGLINNLKTLKAHLENYLHPKRGAKQPLIAIIVPDLVNLNRTLANLNPADVYSGNYTIQDLLKKYISMSQETAVSLNADYLTINGGGHLSRTGISVSKLLPIYASDIPSAVTPLVTVEDLQFADDPYPSASGVRLGGALIWQDRAPALTPDKSNLAAAWNVKAGLQYATPALGAHETYGEFVRYRDPRTYAEITVSAGKNGARTDYLGVSIGKTFFY